jgi:DNA (cytosine-5)-methyltransferase 1
MIALGSLFSGIGGLELGLSWALTEAGISHRVVWQVEREPFPRSILARHWPDADRSVIDVCAAHAGNLASVDLICGGFPCQDLSYAGKGAGLAGERSGLWREYIRIVRALRPRLVVVENVAALVARGLDVVLGDLAESGYDASWRCIRASDVGAPHRRKRLFVVAHTDRAGLVEQRLGRLLDGERSASGDDADGCSGPWTMGDPNGRDEQGGERCERQARGRADAERTGRGEDVGLAEPGMGGAAHGLSGRVDRWPAGPGRAQEPWEAPRTAGRVANRVARLKALGNAVVPSVAREVGRWMIGAGLFG